MQDASSRRVNNKLTEIVDVAILKDILNAFTTATNLMGNIVDTKGNLFFQAKTLKNAVNFAR